MKEIVKVTYVPQVKDKVSSASFGAGYICGIYRSAKYLADRYQVRFFDGVSEYSIDELRWDKKAKVWQVL